MRDTHKEYSHKERYFSVAGVINMGIAHLLIFIAWIVGALEIFFGTQFQKYAINSKIAFVIALGASFLILDRWMTWQANRQNKIIQPSTFLIIDPPQIPEDSDIVVGKGFEVNVFIRKKGEGRIPQFLSHYGYYIEEVNDSTDRIVQRKAELDIAPYRNEFLKEGAAGREVVGSAWSTVVTHPLTQYEVEGITNRTIRIYIIAWAAWINDQNLKGSAYACSWLQIPTNKQSPAWHFCRTEPGSILTEPISFQQSDFPYPNSARLLSGAHAGNHYGAINGLIKSATIGAVMGVFLGCGVGLGFDGAICLPISSTCWRRPITLSAAPENSTVISPSNLHPSSLYAPPPYLKVTFLNVQFVQCIPSSVWTELLMDMPDWCTPGSGGTVGLKSPISTALFDSSDEGEDDCARIDVYMNNTRSEDAVTDPNAKATVIISPPKGKGKRCTRWHYHDGEPPQKTEPQDPQPFHSL